MDVSRATKSGLEGELLRLLFRTVCMDARQSQATAPANRGCRVFEVFADGGPHVPDLVQQGKMTSRGPMIKIKITFPMAGAGLTPTTVRKG